MQAGIRQSGSTAGTVVRALASHQYGPGSIPRLGIIMWVQFVGSLVGWSALRGFPAGTAILPSPQKPMFDLR